MLAKRKSLNKGIPATGQVTIKQAILITVSRLTVMTNGD